jgi:hypothetical protein
MRQVRATFEKKTGGVGNPAESDGALTEQTALQRAEAKLPRFYANVDFEIGSLRPRSAKPISISVTKRERLGRSMVGNGRTSKAPQRRIR